MFKDGVVVVIVGVIALGGIGVWWTQTPTRPWSTTVAPRVQESEPASETAPKAEKTARVIPKPAPAPVVETPLVAEVIPSPDGPPSTTPVVNAPPRPAPPADQIAPGAREDSITGRYGNPSLSTVTLTEGHLIETLVYEGNHSGPATIIRVEDGKVSEVYSSEDRVRPTGVSVPRRGVVQ